MENQVPASLHQLLVDAIPLAIFLTDPSGQIIGWTGSAQNLLGYADRDIIGRDFRTLFRVARAGPHERARELALIDRAANYKEVGNAIRADGSTFLCLFTMDRVADERGVIIGYACTLGPL